MSHSLLDQLKASITPQLISEAAKALGETPEATRQAVHLALPALLSGIGAATRMPSGLSAVLRLVEDPVNDGTLTTQLTSLYKGTMTAAPIYRLGSQLLNAIFGTKLIQMAQGVAALSGIKTASANTLLHMLAPNLLCELGTDHRTVVDKSPEGFARFVERQKAGLAGVLAPTLAEIVHAPMGAGTMAATSSAIAAASSSVAIGAKAASSSIPVASAAAPASRRSEGVMPASTPTSPPKSAAASAAVTGAEIKSAPKAADRKPAIARPSATGGGAHRKGAGGGDAPSTWRAFVIPALLGLGLLWLNAQGMFGSTSPLATVTAKSDTKKQTAQVPASAPTPPLAAPQKAADAKPAPAGTAIAQPKAPAPAVGTNPNGTPAAKTAEATPTAKPDNRQAPSAPKAAAAERPPAKAPAPATESPTPKAAAQLPVTPPGTTSFYGSGKSAAESAAIANPDYKPFVAAAATPLVVPEDRPIAPVPGATSFYGTAPAPAEATAISNPEYKPAAAAVAPAGEIAASDEKSAPSMPGATSFFGASPPGAEQPALANPDYKPAVIEPAPVVVATEPRPAAASGITSYYGVAVPPANAAAHLIPAQRPSAAAPKVAAAAAPPAPVTLKPQSGVTTYFGRSTDPQPAASPAVSCEQSVADAVKSGVILFRSGQADLTASSMPTLKRVVKAFRACPGMRLKIEGHTDDTGAADMNMRLSQARAKSVANYLVLRGMDAARVASAGLGMSQPIAPNTTAENKALNRRIEFKVDKL